MKNNKIKIGFLGMVLLLIIALSLNVNSSGVSSPYWDENPMHVQPGEVKEFSYTLQNMVGNEDIKFQAQLESGTTIMEFVDKNTVYDVPFGSNNILVKMKVVVPKDAKEGDEYQVGVRFTVISSDIPGKPVAIGSAFSKGFRVIVGKPATVTASQASLGALSGQTLGFLILLAILIILILVIKYFKRKEKIK